MEIKSFFAAIFIFLICLLVVFKPSKKVTTLGGIMIIPLLYLVFF
tara:strand:- start:540 stop:674 length:135 start_codon:yes stop_codon:yes gene_type:complete